MNENISQIVFCAAVKMASLLIYWDRNKIVAMNRHQLKVHFHAWKRFYPDSLDEICYERSNQGQIIIVSGNCDKPVAEAKMVLFTDTRMRYSASLNYGSTADTFPAVFT